MRPAYEQRRIVDVMRALRAGRTLEERERFTRPALEHHQRQRLDVLLRHAARHSPFWRERLAGSLGEGPVDLTALPILDKGTMMEHFDDLVTDRRLSRDTLLSHLDGLDRDELYLGCYRAMATSGSSGRKGLFVYDREGWVGIVAQLARCNAMIGIPRPRLPRLRVAAVGGGTPTHMTRRVADTVRGVNRVRSLAATMPLAEIVAALNEFQPDCLNAYPSVASLLAEEQLRGALRIAPRWLSTSSELRTPQATERITAAFGVRPADIYATTEGLWGSSCEEGAVHLFEDMTLIENVDSDGHPVEPGNPGARLLITNLFNHVQPLIRCEIADVVTFDPEPCRCGRSLKRLAAIEGRADDVLQLPGAHGPIAVHPLQFALLTGDRDVREFQIVQEGELLRVRVVLRDGAGTEQTTARLSERVAENLLGLGVRAPHVKVERCTTIERPPSGKVQLVIADRTGTKIRSAATHGGIQVG